jgi:hypothetical protein
VQRFNVDCLKPLKRCTKVCLYGVSRETKQVIDNIALYDAGGLTISPGIELEVNVLLIPIGKAGFVAGAPDDDATDELGQSKGNVPSGEISSLPLGHMMHIGCDLTAASNATLEKRACVDLPTDADVRRLTVRVPRGKLRDNIGPTVFPVNRELEPTP